MINNIVSEAYKTKYKKKITFSVSNRRKCNAPYQCILSKILLKIELKRLWRKSYYKFFWPINLLEHILHVSFIFDESSISKDKWHYCWKLFSYWDEFKRYNRKVNYWFAIQVNKCKFLIYLNLVTPGSSSEISVKKIEVILRFREEYRCSTISIIEFKSNVEALEKKLFG